MTCKHSTFTAHRYDYCPDCGETDLREIEIDRLRAENEALREALIAARLAINTLLIKLED